MVNQIGYFVDWGGKSWRELIQTAINHNEIKEKLKGASFLDIGCNTGKMAVFFSTLGANVTGIDIHQEHLDKAKEEAKKWNADNITFKKYEGDLDIFPDSSFDIIFVKSVLVILLDLEGYLKKINAKLKTAGKVIFLENARSNPFIRLLRTLKHLGKYDHSHVNYFTEKHIKLISSIFELRLVKQKLYPPVYLIIGSKRES